MKGLIFVSLIGVVMIVVAIVIATVMYAVSIACRKRDYERMLKRIKVKIAGVAVEKDTSDGMSGHLPVELDDIFGCIDEVAKEYGIGGQHKNN